uniref:LRRCT domain-containing protein n=2 Tax=Clastoptera arizonana TaxID=38151 RepID=A0A1B6DPY4_9HEMI
MKSVWFVRGSARHVDIFCLYILVLSVVEYSSGQIQSQKCGVFRQSKSNLLSADCIGLNYKFVPQYLNKNIEILVLSENRIRDLNRSNFEEYTSIKYLYLDNNFITIIEEDTFTPLTDLEVLDLSSNAFKSIPSEMPLPLRTLYLSDNPHLESIKLKESFNLKYLEIANIAFKTLPELGVLPNLIELNLTHSKFTTVSIMQLSSLCRLKKIDLSKPIFENNNCDCYKFLTWAKAKHINYGNFTCTSLVNPDSFKCHINKTEEENFIKCLKVEPKMYISRYIIFSSILIGIVAVCLIICCLCRRRSLRKKKAKSRKKIVQQTSQEKKLTTTIY